MELSLVPWMVIVMAIIMGNLDVSTLGVSLGSAYGFVLGTDEGIKLGSPDGEVLGITP